MEFIKKKSKTITFVIVLLLSMLSFGGYILEWKGRKALFAVIVLSAGAAVIFDLLVNKLGKSVWQQLSVAGIIPMLYCLVSVLFNKEMIYTGGNAIYWLYGIFFLTFYIIVTYGISAFEAAHISGCKQFILRHKVMLILLLAALLLRIPYLLQLPRWDSGEYYYRLSLGEQWFEYTSFTEFMEQFSLCGHPTLAFCLVYLIGEMIFPLRVIGVTLVSLILTIIAIWCIYRIFLKILTGISPEKAAVYTFILSMAPLFYSNTMYFNPDYAMTIFLIFTIYSYMYNKPILTGIFSIMCFQTKETGLVLVGGLALGAIVQHIFNEKGKSCVKSIFTDIKLYLILAAAILQLAYNKYIGGFSKWSQNSSEAAGLRWDNNGDNCLGFNPSFIAVKLKQQFLLNFNWIAAAVIIICIVVLIFAKKNKIKQNEKHYICGIVGSFVAFVMFSCLYITASIARYNVAGDVLLYMIMFYCIWHTGKRISLPKAEKIFCAVFAVLLTAQCFVTIDPVTRAAFKQLDAGNRSIYFMGKIDNVNDMYYGDYLIYNTQYTYIDKAYDKMLAESGYTAGETDIILPVSNGSFIAGNIPFYYLSWNSTLGKRVFYTNENADEMESYILAEDIVNKNISHEELNQKAVLVFNPYWLHVDKEKCVESLKAHYDIGEEKTAKTFQGSIYYYELTLKQ